MSRARAAREAARRAAALLLLAGAMAACAQDRPPVEIEASGGDRSGIDRWRIGIPF
jgi:hypothetical protein